ncbi:MAG: symbB, partial [Myxococcaceae bacterium]|nr:symbB [Myxococcaceae bacterium]
MHSYEEAEFSRKMEAALSRVRTILDRTRDPSSPAEVPHSYDDKFVLADFLGRASVASLLLALETVGLDEAGAATLRAWAATRSVTLRLGAHEECTFLREVTRKVEAAQAYVTEERSSLGEKSTRSERIVTTITEYLWSYEVRHELVAFQGADPRDALALSSRGGRIEIKTATNHPPRPRSVARPPLDLDLTWVLRQLDDAGRAAFAIDRTDPACHTPRRNPQIDAALRAVGAFDAWCEAVTAYFRAEVFPAHSEHGLDLAALNPAEVFIPAVPLFDRGGGEVLPVGYLAAFLDEERRSLAEKLTRLDAAFPNDGSVITAREARLVVTLLHAQDLCRHFAAGVDFIEGMLRAQLVAAIGKEVTPAEFAAYMAFHHRKLFKPAYRPQAFSYAVRRPDHDPEGGLSIEARVGSAMPDAISTIVTRRDATRPMSFALDASTRVSFLGERYLHAWVAHQFSGRTELALSLVARARQFSSFLLLVGRISSADTFDPRFGIIVQNKDVLSIPLLLEQIPTPKEFRDAIESLSPEQQRFAKAFRGMQLESTLFGVCVIQIKPQLERLLKLPPDSLTKEIKLTQDLLGLFMEHQIPSDLLSYDGPAEAGAAEKLARVGEYVGRMHAVIGAAKQRELDEAREREAFRLAEANRTPAPVSASMPMMGGPPGFGGPPPSAPLARSR